MRSRIRRPALTPRGRARRREIAEQLHALAARPLISVVMPTYETDPRYLREAIESVRNQRYPDWELCIADDGSRPSAVRAELERARVADPRIKSAYWSATSASRPRPTRPSSSRAASSSPSSTTTTCSPRTRCCGSREALGADPELDVVYSDSDKLTAHGVRRRPVLQARLVAGLRARRDVHRPSARRAPLARRGAWAASIPPSTRSRTSSSCCASRSAPSGSATSRRSSTTGGRSRAASRPAPTRRMGFPELQARAVSAHLDRIGAPARAVEHPRIPHRAQLAADPRHTPPPDELAEQVTVIVAWRGGDGLGRLLASLHEVGERPPAEVIVAGADVTEIERAAGGHPVHALADEGALLNRARALNLAAKAASTPWLLLCSDAAEVVEPDWLDPAVAARVVARRRRRWAADLASRRARRGGRVRDRPRPPGRADAARAPRRRATATTARSSARATSPRSATSFMLVRRAAYEAAGGLEENFLTGYADFDLCQRLRAEGGGVGLRGAPAGRRPRDPGGATRAALDVVDRALFVDCWYDGWRAATRTSTPTSLAPQADYVRRDGGARHRAHRADGAMRLALRLLRPVRRQQRDPGVPLRQRADRPRLGGHRCAAIGDPARIGGSASRASSASPTRISPTCSSAAAAPPSRRSCSPGHRARTCRRLTEDGGAPAGRPLRRPPRGQRGVPARRRRSGRRSAELRRLHPRRAGPRSAARP